ncbi:hypothetical protein ACP6OQ_000008 [Cronobacter dublinensis]
MSGKGSLPVGNISYKEWLVGMAMEGILASDHDDKITAERCARAAIKYANAVLNELENENPITRTKDIL